ncbi:DUF2513 domain-containing protein [Vreelandella venusta]|uniref:DUF2513 domain-containing protein n=1 Tax=Vreelandella venusta TaxID=44935 RepID=UPI00404428D8
MKRNFELIRDLLFYFESKSDSAAIENPEVEGFDKSDIMYHLRLLHDAGFLRCEVISTKSSNRTIWVVPFELTWDGHEFLDQIRADTIWAKIKAYGTEKGIALSFSIITQLAKKYITQVVEGS